MKYLCRDVFMFVVCSIAAGSQVQKPNIVFILADDFGFNDVSYHGANHGSAIKTPFLDSLALSGIRLENYYVQPVCSPTRSQLLSGRYQIHTGLQHSVIRAPQPNGIPLNNILLPEQLKNCGYDTHMLGKWHVGFYKDQYLPWNRGFDSYFGYLIGGEDYYTKYRCYLKMCGYSMNTENGPTNDTYGEYSTYLYARKAGDIISRHNKSNPLFMYIALQSVHAPLQVPESYIKPYMSIRNDNRRIYAGMVSAMDETVKNITDHLKSAGLWNNTVLIFSTDNGGQTLMGGNNWPLRGRKATLWEGGIRGVGFVHGPMLNVTNPNVQVNKQLIHVSDWYPTLLTASGCSAIPGTQSLDGYNQWEAITKDVKSPRLEILHNIDPLFSKARGKFRMGFDTSVHAGIRVGDWKLLTGNPGFSRWVKPPEEQDTAVKFSPGLSITNHVYNEIQSFSKFSNRAKLVQLFNIKYDPYERMELSDIYPDLVNEMLLKLSKYNSTAVPVYYPPDDAKADPKLHGGFWEPWMN